jgi:RNA polymerase sigma-70 factor, ECF subfamily
MSDPLQHELPHLLPRLWRFALRLTRNANDAEDLVQRTCMRAIERRRQWQPGTALLSWLFAIENSIWMNDLRSAQRRRTSSLELEDPWNEQVDPAAGPEMRLHYAQVIQAVDSLPQAQRLVLTLVAIEGMSYREAAEILEIPIGTVMSRLARARIAVGERFRRSEDSRADPQPTKESRRDRG